MVSGSSEAAASEGQLAEANNKLPIHLAKRMTIKKRMHRRMQISKAMKNRPRPPNLSQNYLRPLEETVSHHNKTCYLQYLKKHQDSSKASPK